MLTSQVVTDGSGRVRIVESDDRGEPELILLPAVGDFRGLITHQELISLPLGREPAQQKGSARLGLLLFSANVNPGTVVADYVLLDVIVRGYIGSAATDIKRMAFAALAPDDFLRLDDSNNYDRIGVAGRQIVNGRPSNVALQSLSLQVTGRISR